MHTLSELPQDKSAAYAELTTNLRALLDGESDVIANAANMAALLYWSLRDLNWVGFYLVEPRGGDLLLGPFQGKPACVRIPVGRGVCGTAAARRETVVVRGRARISRPHRVRLGLELGGRGAGRPRRAPARRARSRQSADRSLR